MTVWEVRDPDKLQNACDQARAGDRILIHGGVYAKPSVLKGKNGRPDAPIVFAAADGGWISGGTQPDANRGSDPPEKDAPSAPSIDDFAFLRIVGCRHVVIDGLQVRDCWPTVVYVEDTRHLRIHKCRFIGGTYAIFAKGINTERLLIDDNKWQQDESRDHDLWHKIDWAQAHGGEGSDGRYRYFNGGFFATNDIKGSVVIRRNCITDAYNGIRMKGPKLLPHDVTSRNRDVHILDNDFVRIRDNPIEPERFATNWHVRHNRLVDCHAWFSFDGTDGGYWYFYGNRSTFTSRQGVQGAPRHTMGRVLKLSYETRPPDLRSDRTPRFPWFVFNNSWHLRCPIVGGSSFASDPFNEGPDFTAHLRFFNNAFTSCDPQTDETWLCERIDPLNNFDVARCVDTTFDHTITDCADYLQFFTAQQRGEANGTLATRPIFVGPARGDFSLAANSEALATGWVGTIASEAGPIAPRAGAGGRLNRGAFQDYGLIEVPELEAQASALIAEIAGTS